MFPFKFLSTPSARRATVDRAASGYADKHFYPHPPRGGRPRHFCLILSFSFYFYPHPPRGGRLSPNIFSQCSQSISIHTLREEGDCRFVHQLQKCVVFLSTPSARRATLTLTVLLPVHARFLSTPSARRATAKTERKPSAFVSLYTSLHKLQRGVCKTNRKITPLLVQTAGIPVRSVWENHVRCLFALAGHQKISTLSCANSGCSPTCSTLVW